MTAVRDFGPVIDRIVTYVNHYSSQDQTTMESSPLHQSPPPKPVIVYGEVLIDRLGDGQGIIGGAPMNVAWNLRGLQQYPYLITAIGADDDGKRVLESAEQWGLATDLMQTDVDRPTGVALVHDHGNGPEYDLPREQAYDYIRFPEAFVENLPNAESPILYHGSLCCRSPVSFDTVLQLRRRFSDHIVVDINLRDGHYTNDVVEQLIDGATVLKCNCDELSLITGLECKSHEQVLSVAKDLFEKSSIEELWVTDGASGAYWINKAGEHAKQEAEKIEKASIVDSVGAGDAFMAVVLAGMATNEYRPETLAKAVAFSAKVCQIPGATTSDDRFYSV
ncbi:PfkB family carbohydrate kinase [Stieleria sp. JC731]|uniref:PfkB family carbohydrate kinase n=1 Tax=Pirellulaceae TaxID=2691357 RepID=UPI001E468036|nr:PfkB family carbohydrate kinase [Stieleria sp. JC731]MCC9603945.1 PfkB family carbohydrate kinase [Stieleria sp. JC731]